ncbi:YceI family protein [Paenibacillus sp. y28]|uniref:YceI family protein n=1 Tax=Paenibacillus sp. y28 TaxID=3129110 RepID=UPI003015EC22
MNKKKGMIAAAAAIIIVAGGYSAFNYYTGNHVQIEQVIAANSQVSASSAEIKSDQLNGSWTIAQPSNVYFSITTSKETVNYSMNDVQGSWLVNLSNPTQMTGEGTVDLNTMSSGNNMRDNHVKGNDYLQVTAHPKATLIVSEA